MMPKESIQQMLARCPCDRCPLHDHCKRYEVACATFAWYVESSGITSDLRRIARRERGPQGQMSNPVPTREIYELIYCGIDQIPTGETTKVGNPKYYRPAELVRLREAAAESVAGLI